MENTYGIIYCIENTVNSHKYIGQTIRTFEERISEHFRSVNAKSHKNRAIYKAINKYGKENFISYILDYANDQEELDKKEVYWIGFYDTFLGKGYNMTKGGQEEKEKGEISRTKGDCEFLVFDLNGKYIGERKSQTAFAKEIGCEHGSVTGCISGRKPTVKGFILINKSEYTDELLKEKIERIKRYGKNKPDFEVFNIKTNEFLGVWNNVIDCCRFLKIKSHTITSQLSGNNQNTKLFKIQYVTSINNNYKYKEELNNYET